MTIFDLARTCVKKAFLFCYDCGRRIQSCLGLFHSLQRGIVFR